MKLRGSGGFWLISLDDSVGLEYQLRLFSDLDLTAGHSGR